MQHYVKKRIGISATGCGHCIRNTRTYKKGTLQVCEHWEDGVVQKEEHTRKIKDAIISMSKSLEELTVILKDDIQG